MNSKIKIKLGAKKYTNSFFGPLILRIYLVQGLLELEYGTQTLFGKGYHYSSSIFFLLNPSSIPP